MTLTDKNPESSLSLHEDPDESYDSHAAKLRHDLGAGKWAAESGLPNDQYAADRNADVHGTANPTLMEKPFWKYMVYEKLSAYRARDIFEAPKDPFDYPNPVWCFERSGATRTKLPDGRIVCIGGEHEDFYDPDFYIYNDVIVFSPPPAREMRYDVQIYGYPTCVFPPTDHHTSTYVSDPTTSREYIIVIGGLGYSNAVSRNQTEVYQLDLGDFSMKRIETSRKGPAEGIADHKAELVESPEGPVLVITTQKVKVPAEGAGEVSDKGSDEHSGEDAGDGLDKGSDKGSDKGIDERDDELLSRVPADVLHSEGLGLRIRDWTWIPWTAHSKLVCESDKLRDVGPTSPLESLGL